MLEGLEDAKARLARSTNEDRLAALRHYQEVLRQFLGSYGMTGRSRPRSHATTKHAGTALHPWISAGTSGTRVELTAIR
jgi:hypothetical protein